MMMKLQPRELWPEGDLFAAMRVGFSYVAELSRNVVIDHTRLNAFVASLPAQAPQNVLDEEHHYYGDAESTAAYILILDALNFGSGYKPGLADAGWELIDGSIYYTVSTRLKHYFEQNGPFTAEQLCALTVADCAHLLGVQNCGTLGAEFAEFAAQSLNDLGAVIIEDGNGSFMQFVEAAQGSVENLVRMLLRMPLFHDESLYLGRTVAFYKRAQIAAADLHIAFKRRGRQLFGDINRLTMFADNAVPHVLRTAGILIYTPDLAARIDAGEEIPAGSEEEVEIRACAAHVIELIATQKRMAPMDIDHILWHLSVEDERYDDTKAHRTKTVYY